MSFTYKEEKSPNYIPPNCYFVLKKSIINKSTNSSSHSFNILGDISAINILLIDPSYNQPSNTIITNSTLNNSKSTDFIVGIPNNNNNNLSKKQIFSAMNFYNIDLLRSIRPYVKLAGNDVSFTVDNCINAEERKYNVLQYSGKKLPSKQFVSMISKLNLEKKVCLSNNEINSL